MVTDAKVTEGQKTIHVVVPRVKVTKQRALVNVVPDITQFPVVFCQPVCNDSLSERHIQPPL